MSVIGPKERDILNIIHDTIPLGDREYVRNTFQVDNEPPFFDELDFATKMLNFQKGDATDAYIYLVLMQYIRERFNEGEERKTFLNWINATNTYLYLCELQKNSKIEWTTAPMSQSPTTSTALHEFMTKTMTTWLKKSQDPKMGENFANAIASMQTMLGFWSNGIRGRLSNSKPYTETITASGIKDLSFYDFILRNFLTGVDNIIEKPKNRSNSIDLFFIELEDGYVSELEKSIIIQEDKVHVNIISLVNTIAKNCKFYHKENKNKKQYEETKLYTIYIVDPNYTSEIAKYIDLSWQGQMFYVKGKLLNPP